MNTKILWKANFKRHLGAVCGIFVLILLAILSLTTVLTVWHNSSGYVHSQMNRLGYGRLTAWVSGLPDIQPLADEIAAVDGVSSVGIQPLIYAEYETLGQESDSEGQLILYEPEWYNYKIFTPYLSGYETDTRTIAPGEILVSPSMQSMFGVKPGDTIIFPIARSGVNKSFVVTGFYEDPIMGSSMIGMKGFLICRQDYDEITQTIAQSGGNGLARCGYMLHISSADATITAAQFNALLNQNTRLNSYTEFTHSDDAISGFMLTLQNVFTGLLLAFVVVLLLASLIVLSHSISGAIEQDTVNMGILKAIGYTTGKLRRVQLLQMLTGILPGMVLGLLFGIPAAGLMCRMTVTTTGILVPAQLPLLLCLGASLLILALIAGFVWLKTGGIGRVTPMAAIRDEQASRLDKRSKSPLRAKPLGLWLALRQLASGKKRYVGACLVAVLLVFFASLIGRIDSWLGPNGEGMMDAFNPADLHIAAQPMGEIGIEDVEQVINKYTEITDQYMLAMPSVSVNGVDYTANVITDPSRFHMLEGRSCTQPDEIVLTEFVAADMAVKVGDLLTVSGSLGSASFTVSGIYQCANDMGANVGMKREGYDRIAQEGPNIWCTHYFIRDPSLQPAIMQALVDTFGSDVYLHENAWPGLYGILSAMNLLLIFLYGIILIFVLVVTLLTADKLIHAERRDLAIYKAVGLSAKRLRVSFAMRFCLIALAGSSVGALLSAVLTDPLVDILMRMFGISNFSSHPGVGSVLLPAAVVTVLFTAFAWLASGGMKKTELTELITE